MIEGVVRRCKRLVEQPKRDCWARQVWELLERTIVHGFYALGRSLKDTLHEKKDSLHLRVLF